MRLLLKRLQSIDWQAYLPVLLIGLFIVGILLRLAPIVRNRFHQDEAIYSQWALQIMSGRNPWLAGLPIDKPPLFIYVLAGFFALFGPSETTARLPSELASAASLILVYFLANRLFGRLTAVIALALTILSPFSILFAPTVFTDPLMTAFILAALLAAACSRAAWTGLLLGLAVISKPQAILFLPLALFIYHIFAHRVDPVPESSADALDSFAEVGVRRTLPAGRTVGTLRLSGALAVAVVPAFVWDAFRGQHPGFMQQSIISYGGLNWAPAVDWLGRLADWRALLAYFTGSSTLDLLLVVGLPILLILDLTLWRSRWTRLVDFGLAAFCLLFLAAHVVTDFNVWDRYLLPLAPCVAMLLARVLAIPVELLSGVRPRPVWRAASAVAIGALLLFTAVRPAQDAAASRFPIGGDHGAYEGLDALVNYYRGHLPGDSILYHHWLGWHYSFYLFNFPYQMQYYDTPEELAAHAAAHPGAPRFVAFPSWHSSTQLAWVLGRSDLAMRVIYETYREDGSRSFTLFRIEEASG